MIASSSSQTAISVDLIAVLVAVSAAEPRVLTIQNRRALPSGPLELAHRSLQSGLRAWVERQTRLPLGYIEQLYTFADQGRAGAAAQHAISISYLGLTRERPTEGEGQTDWVSWYRCLPWEDHRAGVPLLIDKTLKPALTAWANAAPDKAMKKIRRDRAALLFGFDDRPWNEELVLQRYELLYEAGLVQEAIRDRAIAAPGEQKPELWGHGMTHDHRRILATGIARLRRRSSIIPWFSN